MKTQKASDSFVWAGFIVSWFMTSPALTSHYTWIDFTCASRHITQSILHSVKIDATFGPLKGSTNTTHKTYFFAVQLKNNNTRVCEWHNFRIYVNYFFNLMTNDLKAAKYVHLFCSLTYAAIDVWHYASLSLILLHLHDIWEMMALIQTPPKKVDFSKEGWNSFCHICRFYSL